MQPTPPLKIKDLTPQIKKVIKNTFYFSFIIGINFGLLFSFIIQKITFFYISKYLFCLPI